MNKPKMIMFDYGHTLLHEPEYNFLRGQEALYKHVSKNKNNLTAKQINDFADELFKKTSVVRNIGFELNERQFQGFLYEYLGIEFSISLSEAEKVMWEGVSMGAVMPDADKMIDYINEKGIRSGVISNIGWTGEALNERIDRLLPRNKFEFVIASSDYMFRKPSSMLFDLALRKADLNATDVWYCGDKVRYDVEGSAAVGIFPVWYEELTIENPWRDDGNDLAPQCEHLHIHDWLDMIEILEGLN